MATTRRRRPAPKPKILAPVRPNAGIEASYRAKLDALVAEMQRSILYFVSAAYRANEPEMAQDAPEGSFGSGMSPAMALRETMRKLGRRWQKRFDEAAPELAKYFATAVSDRSDGALRSILKRAGLSVEFKMTAAANDVVQATIGANVALIKSIPEQHLKSVEGAVMRSIQTGRDLGTLAKELQEAHGVTRRRAALIARTQNNMATASIVRVRQQALGITHATWLHSAGGREPRPTHIANSGKPYPIAEGWYDPAAKKHVWPGELINCRCVAKPILPQLS